MKQSHPKDGISYILQTKKSFEHLTDKSKQEVLLNFIQKKSVLRAVYDIMFGDKELRSKSHSPN